MSECVLECLKECMFILLCVCVYVVKRLCMCMCMGEKRVYVGEKECM